METLYIIESTNANGTRYYPNLDLDSAMIAARILSRLGGTANVYPKGPKGTWATFRNGRRDY